MTSTPGSPLLLRLREAKAFSIPSKTASDGRADVALDAENQKFHRFVTIFAA
jgi:hypothetical protein